MANRIFNQFSWGLEKYRVQLFGKVAIGSTGACTLSAANSKGITSITRNNVGKYTIVLNDPYQKFMGLKVTVLLASGLSVVGQVCVMSETVATAATKNIVIQCLGFDGAAVEADSGTVLYFEVNLNNTTAI